MRLVFAIFVVSVFVSGCATQGVNSLKYQPGTPKQVQNEITVSKPYSEVWDKLVKELSKSFYVINNIDKESRIINISFSSSSPSDYVDCGRSHRTYSKGDKVQVFDYGIVEKAKYVLATDRQPDKNFSYYGVVNRNPSLDGLANVYVAPSEIDKNKTTVTVNVRYVAKVDVTGELFSEHWRGMLFPQGSVPPTSSTFAFNTNQVGSFDVGGGEPVKCFSTGNLENEILKMVTN